MNYGVVWRPGALESIATFGDESIFDCIELSIRFLAEDPAGVSERSFQPEFPGALSFDFRCRGRSGYVELRAYFFYTADETKIRIVEITLSVDG
ncbi:MAG TPA: hypothetical protein VF278_17465 [Pirellulales bacterium]